MKRTYSIISHTHWDREWYLPFEQFRIRLVDLIDHLQINREVVIIFHVLTSFRVSLY